MQQHDRHGAKGLPACSTRVPPLQVGFYPGLTHAAPLLLLLQALDASHTEHMRQFFPCIRSLTLNRVQFSGNTALCLATVTQLQALALHKCTFTVPEDLVVLGALPGEHWFPVVSAWPHSAEFHLCGDTGSCCGGWEQWSQLGPEQLHLAAVVLHSCRS